MLVMPPAVARCLPTPFLPWLWLPLHCKLCGLQAVHVECIVARLRDHDLDVLWAAARHVMCN